MYVSPQSTCAKCLDDFDTEDLTNEMLCPDCVSENLGQELDRWQLIARDLLGYIHPSAIEADPFLLMVHTELSAMPEIHQPPLNEMGK